MHGLNIYASIFILPGYTRICLFVADIDVGGDVLDDLRLLRVVFGQILDPLDGVEHGGVVPALELLADLLQRQVGHPADEVHGDLPGQGGVLGAALPPEGAQEPADRADSDEHSEEFDYSTFYRQFQETGAPQVDPLRQTYQAAFGKEEVMDGIPCKDWADFIGPASPAYLSAYCRMQLSHTKTSMSFSAMLFGPFYFFYRKAWKPAFAFLAAELVLALPTFIDLLQVTDSSLAPGLSTSTLLTLSRVCSVLSFLLMIVRGLYGKWLYRQSAAEKIRRIRAEFPDAAQRKAVLCAQGGTSWAAVLGCLVLLMVIGSAFTLLLGPNVDALIHLVYG